MKVRYTKLMIRVVMNQEFVSFFPHFNCPKNLLFLEEESVSTTMNLRFVNFHHFNVAYMRNWIWVMHLWFWGAKLPEKLTIFNNFKGKCTLKNKKKLFYNNEKYFCDTFIPNCKIVSDKYKSFSFFYFFDLIINQISKK